MDLLLAKTPYQSTAIRRARTLGAGSVAFPYLAPEDVVVHKLLAYRFRGRDDLESLTRAAVKLDEAYVEHWCDVWEIRERWEELKRSRG